MAYHRFHKVNTRIVRIFNTYGPRMRLKDGRVVPAFVSQALQGQPITVFGDGKQTRSFCFVSDLIDGIYRLSQAQFHEPVNIGNPLELTIKEFGERIVRLTGSASTLVFQPLPTDDPKQRRPDITRAKQLLGWEPKVELEDGLRETIEYFKGRLPPARSDPGAPMPPPAPAVPLPLRRGAARRVVSALPGRPGARTDPASARGGSGPGPGLGCRARACPGSERRRRIVQADPSLHRVVELIGRTTSTRRRSATRPSSPPRSRGWLSSLDPHSQFLDEDALRRDAARHQGGVHRPRHHLGLNKESALTVLSARRGPRATGRASCPATAS